jgi:hypothetical protein
MWQKVALAAVFSALGFVAGLVAAPRIHERPAPAQAAVDVDRESPSPVAAAVVPRAAPRAPTAVVPPPRLAPAPPAQLEPGNRRGLDSFPAPVKEAAARLLAGGDVKHLDTGEREHDGKTYYKIEFERAGTKREYYYDAQGSLAHSELQLALGDIPTRVQQALAEALPGAGILKGKRLEGGLHQAPLYEIDVSTADSRREVQVNDAGEIVRIKVK